jgi:YD repeat-containing protein
MTRLQNLTSTSATLADFGGTVGMGYDSEGNVTSMSCNMPGSNLGTGDTTYAQDDKNELTSEQSTRNGGITNSFAYDTAFNPTTFRNQTRTFNANNQDTAQSYDGNGNPHLLGAYSLSFDPENRLTEVGSLLTAGYDGDDVRAWKQDNLGGTELTSSGRASWTHPATSSPPTPSDRQGCSAGIPRPEARSTPSIHKGQLISGRMLPAR